MTKINLIGLDADDTLWHNERYYAETQAKFAGLLSHYQPEDWVRKQLLKTETRNIEHFGYGIKAFALSMIETAVELTDGRISGQDIGTLIEMARGMIDAKVELLEHVAETIPKLAASHKLALITKGDLLDQEKKVLRSGLAGYFQNVEIVSQKNSVVYARLLTRLSVLPENFLMVGNSLRSDILPVLELGGKAVYIPHEITWEHETASLPASNTTGYFFLDNFGKLPELIEGLEED